MPKLGPISRRELIKKLNILGFAGPYQEGKHPYMINRDLVITIPNPHESDVSVDLLVRILRQAGVSRDEWLSIK